MKFQYDKEKDVWCLLNKGKSSNNSSSPTKQYQALINAYGENPTAESTSSFIDSYILENNIDIQKYITDYQRDWSTVSSEYHKRAEAIFGVALPNEVTAYLTINDRCPYSIENNYFYVRVPASSVRKTIIHELWHFYTWYGLGTDQVEKLGAQKYNDLKEALTVLLNDIFPDLLGDSKDIGYPQHQELRREILNIWQSEKDIKKLWEKISTYFR